jgi:hypothetical protein
MATPSITDSIERFRIETEFKLDQTIEVRRHNQAEERITWTRHKDLGYEFSAEVWLERALEKDQTRAVKRVRTSTNSAIDYRKELLAMVELSQVCPRWFVRKRALTRKVANIQFCQVLWLF